MINASVVKSNELGLNLNFLQVGFSSNKLNGEILPYVHNEHLKELQDKTKDSWICRRRGNFIQAVPYTLENETITLGGEKREFTILEDHQLYTKVLNEGVRRLLKVKYPKYSITEFGKVLFKITGESNSILSQAFQNNKTVFEKIKFLKIFRCYEFETAYVRSDKTQLPSFGVKIKLSTSWEFGISVQQLSELGVDLRGCYVVPFSGSQHEQIGYKTIGAIKDVVKNQIYLIDNREKDLVEADQYTIEGSQENVSLILKSLLGDSQGTSANRSIRNAISSFLGSKEQQERIEKIAVDIFQKPIDCALNLTADVSLKLLSVTPNSEVCRRIFVDPPSYLLKFGGAPTKGPIARAIDSQGPFDKENFKKTTPSVLVITPKKWFGQVDQFMKNWRDGNLPNPYQKGFVNKYALRGCDVHYVDFDETSQESIASYEDACVQAMKESREKIKRYDLAFIVISEKHRLMRDQDPYLSCKAILMGHEVPVQALEIETINSPVANWPYVMNNISLASYAKMGGTPWVLATPRGQGISHEIIVGLGSVSLRDSRLGEKQRYVGITTLFNYDGVYLVSKTSQEVAYEDYLEKLKNVLAETVIDISKRKGWQKGDRVRVVVHTFKPLKNVEIEAVKDLVNNKLKDFVVDFAFLIISSYHNWMIYDPLSKGLEFPRDSGRFKGKQVPGRGNVVILNEFESLLSVTGPAEIKFEDQGTPAPLHIRLDRASTFQDLKYLTEQVFAFTYISWQTFNLISTPVTIVYSDMIARLLGRLRPIKNWNANILETSELSKSLWFI